MAIRIPDPETLDRLAADYALGTMPDSARRRFERMIDVSPEARAALTAWEERLVGLTDSLGEMTPSASIRTALEQAISDQQAASLTGSGAPANDRGRDSRRNFLRGFAAASVMAVVAAGAYVFLNRQPSSRRPSAIAILRDDKGAEAYVVQVSANGDRIQSYALAAAKGTTAVPSGKQHHLWLISPKAKAPISLGTVDLSDPALVRPQDQALLREGVAAVSLEPARFDPSGGPTGPVLFKGPFRAVR